VVLNPPHSETAGRNPTRGKDARPHLCVSSPCVGKGIVIGL